MQINVVSDAGIGFLLGAGFAFPVRLGLIADNLYREILLVPLPDGSPACQFLLDAVCLLPVPDGLGFQGGSDGIQFGVQPFLLRHRLCIRRRDNGFGRGCCFLRFLGREVAGNAEQKDCEYAERGFLHYLALRISSSTDIFSRFIPFICSWAPFILPSNSSLLCAPAEKSWTTIL